MQGVRSNRRLQLAARALGDDAAMVDDGEPLREPVRLIEVLRREEHCRTSSRDAAHEVPHLRPAARIEARRRLVEEEDLRNGDEACRDVDAAPLTAGVGQHLPASGVGQTERVEQLGGALSRGAPRQSEQPAHEHEILVPREILVDGRVLAGQAHLLPHRARLTHHVVAEDGRGARGGFEQRGEDADGGGLARAVGAEQTVHRSFTDTEVHAIQGAGFPKGFDEAARLYRVAHLATILASGYVR
jgi:hypothetical protein